LKDALAIRELEVSPSQFLSFLGVLGKVSKERVVFPFDPGFLSVDGPGRLGVHERWRKDAQ
jgi:hypothetical protein